MMMKSGAIDLERIDSIAGRFGTQVKRADQIIGNLNHFAHSIEKPLEEIDVCGSLQLAVALSHRFASMRGVTIDLDLPDTPVHIKTNPFFLNHLFWLCLDFAMDVSGEGKTVKINCEKPQSQIDICFLELHDLRKFLKNRCSLSREK
jgi:hypothetical protein